MTLSGNSSLQPSSDWAVPFSITCGAMLQAFVAVCLVKRFVSYQHDGTSSKNVILLALTAGPIAILISSSVGILTLRLANLMPNEVVLLNWFNWWIGDSIGVFIFFPVIVAFSLVQKHLTKLVPFFLSYLLLITIVIVMFSQTSAHQLAKQQTVFDAKALGMNTAIIKQTENILHASQTLASMFSLFDSIRFSQFKDYTDSIYDFIPGTHVLSLISVVAQADRNAYERRMGLQLLEDYQFKERDSTTGNLVVAGPRETCYPVYYIARLASNKAALGFNIGSHPGRKNYRRCV